MNLTELKFRYTSSSVPGYPGETEIFLEYSEGKWALKGSFGEMYKRTPVSIVLNSKIVEQSIEQLGSFRITSIPTFVLGLDGTTHKLEISNGLNRQSYEWWSELPEGYDAIRVFVDWLYQCVHLEPDDDLSLTDLIENNFSSLTLYIDKNRPQQSIIEICNKINRLHCEKINYFSLFDEVASLASQRTIFNLLKIVLFKLPKTCQKAKHLTLVSFLNESKHRILLIEYIINYFSEMSVPQNEIAKLKQSLDPFFKQLSQDEKRHACLYTFKVYERSATFDESKVIFLDYMFALTIKMGDSAFLYQAQDRLLALVEKFDLPNYSLNLTPDSENPDDYINQQRIEKLRAINSSKREKPTREADDNSPSEIFNDEIDFDDFDDDNFGSI